MCRKFQSNIFKNDKDIDIGGVGLKEKKKKVPNKKKKSKIQKVICGESYNLVEDSENETKLETETEIEIKV